MIRKRKKSVKCIDIFRFIPYFACFLDNMNTTWIGSNAKEYALSFYAADDSLRAMRLDNHLAY